MRTVELQQLAQYSNCADHPGSRLSIRRHQGEPTIWCSDCDAPPRAMTTQGGILSAYRAGEPIAAALNSAAERTTGMTEERQTQAVALREQAVMGGQLPTQQQAREILRYFTGWTPSQGGPPPSKDERGAAGAIWSMMKVGIEPHEIHVLGGTTPYISLTGYINHARRMTEARGETWGRIVWRMGEPEERALNRARDGDLLIVAQYQERVFVKVTEADGTVVERPEWFDGQYEFGRANEKDTVMKSYSGGNTREQPVERAQPGEMARARATRKLCRLLAGGQALPKDVAVEVDGSVVIDDEPDRPAIAEAQVVVPENVDVETGEIVEDTDPEPVEAEAVGPAENETDDAATQAWLNMAEEADEEDEEDEEDEPAEEVPSQPAEPELPTMPLSPRDPDTIAAEAKELLAGLKGADLHQKLKRARVAFTNDGQDYTGDEAITQMLLAGWDKGSIIEAVRRAQ